jgi:GNAT superfamily N-acetyltransferase
MFSVHSRISVKTISVKTSERDCTRIADVSSSALGSSVSRAVCFPDVSGNNSNRFTISPVDSAAIRLRTMAKADIPAGIRLKEIAGWNQTAADWERFLEASPQGCFVAEHDGRVCGTATTVSFENRVAWIGMVLVDPEYRSRGIGSRLLERAIEYLNDLQITAIKLDATPQGKPLYEKLQFVAEYQIERWTLQRTASEMPKPSGFGSRETLSQELLDSIFEADKESFGADRSFLLKSLHRDAPEFTMGIRNAGAIEAYALGRRGSFADHLGPWMARNTTAACSLLEAFLARSPREVVVVDSLKSNAVARQLLMSFGFSYSRGLTRMYRGRNDHPGRPELLCAILGPEFG